MLTVRFSLLLCSCAALAAPLAALDIHPQVPPLPTIAAKTAGLERRDGFVPIVLDQAADDDVRAMAELTLGTLRTEAASRGQGGAPAESRAHWRAIATEIATWERDRRVPVPAALPAPPGDPFGEDEEP